MFPQNVAILMIYPIQMSIKVRPSVDVWYIRMYIYTYVLNKRVQPENN